MPGLDGMEVLRRIRSRLTPPAVAVLTAVPTAANTIEAIRLGAVDHLAKPVGRDDLAALLAHMCRPNRLPDHRRFRTRRNLIGSSARDAHGCRSRSACWPIATRRS